MAVFARLSSCTSSLFITHDWHDTIESTIITCIYVPPSADLSYHRALNGFLANLSPAELSTIINQEE